MHRFVAVAIALLAVSAACSDGDRTSTGSADTTTSSEPLGAEGLSGGRFPSLRSNLTSELATVIATVEQVDGDEVTVLIDEVVTPGYHAGKLASCATRVAGERISIDNITDGWTNDLRSGDQAVFVGITCDEHQDTVWLVPDSPNGRKVTDGRVDLGNGDIVTLDEVRSLAGSDWQDIEPMVDPPTVTIERDGNTLRLHLTGGAFT